MPQSREDAKEWADGSLGALYGELVEFDRPLTRDEAAKFVRAAYAKGYCDSLTEAEPRIIADALEARDILTVMVPVQ
jgi:hypothetical protein